MMLRCNIEPYGVFSLKEHCIEPYGEIHTGVCVSVRLSIAQLFIAMEERMMRITSAAGFSKAKEMEDRILRAGTDAMKTWVAGL